MSVVKIKDKENTSERHIEEVLSALERFSQDVSEKIEEAVRARASAGIDTQWTEDDQYYNGNYDYENAITKGRTTEDTPRKIHVNRANEFLNITRKYTDASSAKLSDMLIPNDDKNFSILPTPIPDYEDLLKDQTPVLDPQTMQPMVNAQQQPKTLGEEIKEQHEKALVRARNGQTRIYDWLVECDFEGEIRTVIESTARLGVGVIKGAYPEQRKIVKVRRTGQESSISITQEIKPASKAISAWNFFPDGSCGDNIHNGAFVCERDLVTRRTIEKLLDDKTYIKRNIIRVLKEKPERITAFGKDSSQDKRSYELWYFYGRVSRDDFIIAGGELEDEQVELDNVDAMVVMINNKIIKVALNPDETGEFPYDVMPYSKKEGTWIGDGVPRQMRTAQRLINAGINAMMDNHALSSGSILFVRKKGVTPQNGTWSITPHKVYLVDDEVVDIRNAFSQFQVASNLRESVELIQFGLKMAEDVTGLPMLLQGQIGGAPDTLGGMQILNNNASTVLRRLARLFDEHITEPHINRYHRWLIQYGENEEEKCDAVIQARGSTSLVERDIQNQTISQMLQLSLNPAYGIDPKRAFREFLKAQRLDPNEFVYSEKEMQEMMQQSQQQPQDPRLVTAQINQQIKAQELEAKTFDAQVDREFEMQKLQMQLELETMKMANARELTLEQLKAELSKVAMRVKSDREMFASEVQLKRDVGQGI